MLEFFALFIVIRIALRQIQAAVTPPAPTPTERVPPGGHRLRALADNTSALSWLRYATRTRRDPVRRIARLLVSFLSHPFAASIIRIQGKHISGLDNLEADHLSRYEKSPSWASVTANCSELQTLRICLLPPELLSTLAAVFSKPQIAAWYDEETTKLWTIEPPIFVTGSNLPVGLNSSLTSRPSDPHR